MHISNIMHQMPNKPSLCLIVVFLLSVTPVWSDDSAQFKQQVQRIAKGLRCPTCQAISVWGSNAPFALQMRVKIEKMVHEGQSDQQIKAYFVSRYGEWILRAPPWRGWQLLVWLLPLLFLGLGSLWLFKHRRSSVVPLPKLTVAQKSRVQADLQRWEQLS